MNTKAWNWRLWVGFALALLAAFGYPMIFPFTRSIFWIGLALCIVAVVFLISGLRRAFRQPEFYRGKVAGPILTTASVLMFVLFGAMSYMMPKAYSVARNAPRVGTKAPDFVLTDTHGNPVTLSQLLSTSSPSTGSQPPRGILLVFYRGYCPLAQAVRNTRTSATGGCEDPTVIAYFALSRSTGTLMLCWTRLAVVPRKMSARKRCPCVLIATRSHPFCLIHLMISSEGSP